MKRFYAIIDDGENGHVVIEAANAEEAMLAATEHARKLFEPHSKGVVVRIEICRIEKDEWLEL